MRIHTYNMCVLCTGCPAEDSPIAISPENENIQIPFLYKTHRHKDYFTKSFGIKVKNYNLLLLLFFWEPKKILETIKLMKINF